MNTTTDPDPRISETEDRLRKVALAEGFVVTADDRVSEKAAATLIGYSESAMRARRVAGSGPHFYARSAGGASRFSYRLRELAVWIERGRDLELDENTAEESLGTDTNSQSRQ